MIIGVALVVDELSKGQHLVFRYPLSTPSSVLNSHPALLKYHNDYLSITPNNFARLFRPKSQFHNKVSELTIDDLTYICYPCPCIGGSLGANAATANDDQAAAALMAAAGSQGDDLGQQAAATLQKFSMTMFNVIIATISKRAMREMELATQNTRISTSRAFGSTGDASTPARPVEAMLGLETKSYVLKINIVKSVIETFSKGLLLNELATRYVSSQVKLLLKMSESSSKKGAAGGSGSASAVDGSDIGGVGGADSNGGGNSLPLEQGVDSDAQGAAGASGTVHGVGSDKKELVLMDRMLHSSSLSNELRLLFHGLVGGHMVNLTINNLLTMKTPIFDTGALEHPNTTSSGGGGGSSMDADLEKGLLLLSEANELADLLAALGTYASPHYSGGSSSRGVLGSRDAAAGSGGASSNSYSVKEFLSKCSPTRTLRDVAIELNEPYPEVHAFAAQLIQWDLARLTSIVTRRSVFRVNPNKEELSARSLDYRVVAPIQRLLAGVLATEEGSGAQGCMEALDVRRLVLYIVSLFNGSATLQEVLYTGNRFPSLVKPFALDILVVLLRCSVLLDVGEEEVRA